MVISLINVEGFVPALMALRLPHNGGCQSDVYVEYPKLKSGAYGECWYADISQKDLTLLKALRTKGDSDAKVLRGIRAWFQVTAPRYWWAEAVTYENGVTKIGSDSTMHTQAKGLRGKELQDVKGDIRERTENTRIFSMSYQTLTKVVRERKDHRLPEWAEFLDVVYSLPYYEELIKPIDHKAIIKQQMINKAVKWLRDELSTQETTDPSYPTDVVSRSYYTAEELVEAFREAMKGGANGND